MKRNLSVAAGTLCLGILSTATHARGHAPAFVQQQAPVQQQPAVEFVAAPPPVVVYVQEPVVNIGRRHGSLRDAQGFIVQAFRKVSNAQANNDGQLGGHAQRAKELLIQADLELRQAATVSNAEGR